MDKDRIGGAGAATGAAQKLYGEAKNAAYEAADATVG